MEWECTEGPQDIHESLVPSNPVRGHPLVEQAHATLCRLADAPPATAAVKAAITELEEAWDKPFAAGIGGDVAARTELFNAACGAKLFDPSTRPSGSTTVRIRRGAEAGFRAIRGDGSIDERALPDERTAAIAAARSRATFASDALAASVAIERVPPLPPRPAWWHVWRWPRYWRETKRVRALRDARPDVDPLAAARAEASALAMAAEALEAAARIGRERYIEELRDVAGRSNSGCVEVAITTVTALPEEIELVELANPARAGAEIDAVLLAKGDKLFAPTRGGHPLALGGFAEVLPALRALLADARALRLAKRVEVKIKGVMASLADAIERKEDTFRQRIGKLHAMRLADPEGFAAEQLTRLRGEVSASVTTVVEHASVHLGSELAALQDEWIGNIAVAMDNDALKAAVAKVDEEWEARPRRIADEVRVLVVGGLAGSARDIYPRAVEPLGQYGLPEDKYRVREAPELPSFTLLPSLSQDAGKLEKGGWLAGLFKSFDGKRTDVREKVHDRVERMRELAASEVLDAEPRLNATILAALSRLMETAIAAQQAWIEGALEAERAAIDKDREVLTPLRSVHDAVRTETYRLSELIAQLERQQPAIAVAAAAAETASSSR
jgi:hypothetical protein